MLKNSAKIMILFGKTGSGKGTLAKELLAQYPDKYNLISSITTRAPRESDMPGEYTYVSEKEFDALQVGQDVLWKVGYGSTRYAVSKQVFIQQLEGQKVGMIALIPDETVLTLLPEFLREIGAWDKTLFTEVVVESETELTHRLLERGMDRGIIEERFVKDRIMFKNLQNKIPNLLQIKNDGTVDEMLKDFLKLVKMRAGVEPKIPRN